MRVNSSILLLLGSSAVAMAAVTTCNANNCLRQVRASAFSTRTPSQDCVAFQTKTTTVTSTSYTTTVYVAATPLGRRAEDHDRGAEQIEERADGRAHIERRADPITATVPAYASACTSPGSYASACNCIGVPAGTSTVTTTETAGTQTVSVATGCPTGNYVIQHTATNQFITGLRDTFTGREGSNLLAKAGDGIYAEAPSFTFVVVDGLCRLSYSGLPGSLSTVVYRPSVSVTISSSTLLRVIQPGTDLGPDSGTYVATCEISSALTLSCRIINTNNPQQPQLEPGFNGRSDLLSLKQGTSDVLLIFPAPI